MEVTTDNLYLENLEEEVIERNNIVTYKWLMKALKVTSNVAKQMLFEFVETQRKNGVELNVTYLVAGQRRNDDSIMNHELCVVPAFKVESIKSKFTIVTSVHIYAVHKSPVQDHAVLYATDYDPRGIATEDLKKSCAIICKAVHFRDTKDIDDLIGVDAESPPTTSKEQNHKLTSCKNKTSTSKRQTSGAKKQDGKGQAIAIMFQNMGKKKLKTEHQNGNEVHDDKGSASISQDAELPTSNDKEHQNTKLLVEKESGKQPSPTPRSESDECNKTLSVPQRAKSEMKSKSVTNKKGKVKRKAESIPTAKKRRRIIEMSDSSTEDSTSSEPESPIPLPHPADIESEDSEEPLPPNPESKEDTRGGRHRRKKLIEETVADEDGFLVTHKILTDMDVSEGSDNENEEPIPAPKNQVQKTSSSKQVKGVEETLPKAPIMKNKQATLTNFFKRK